MLGFGQEALDLLTDFGYLRVQKDLLGDRWWLRGG